MQLIEHFAGSSPIFGVCWGSSPLARFLAVILFVTVMHARPVRSTTGAMGFLPGCCKPFTATRYHSLGKSGDTARLS